MKGVSIVRPLLLTLAITYVPAAAADQHEQHAGRAPSPEPAAVHFVSSCQQVVAKDFDLRALYGAARAAEQAGELKMARDYYRKLLELCERADQPGRPEVQQARRALARR